MALKSNIKTNHGVPGNYAIVVGLPQYDRVKKVAVLSVAFFYSKEAREAGNDPLKSESFTVQNQSFRRENRIPLTLENARTLPEYSERKVKKVKDENNNEIEVPGDFIISDKVVSDEIKGKTIIAGYYEENIDFFDRFEQLNTEKGWQEAGYDFLKNHPATKELFEAETI